MSPLPKQITVIIGGFHSNPPIMYFRFRSLKDRFIYTINMGFQR